MKPCRCEALYGRWGGSGLSYLYRLGHHRHCPLYTPRTRPGRFSFTEPLVAPLRAAKKRRERRAPALGRRR